jgi:hypothetical protein
MLVPGLEPPSVMLTSAPSFDQPPAQQALLSKTAGLIDRRAYSSPDSLFKSKASGASDCIR